MEVIERRKKERIELAMEFVRSLEELRPLTAIVIGSTARGYFNEWSDIDVVIISNKFPDDPLRRFDLVEKPLRPGIEPIPLRMSDLLRLVRKRAPVVEDMRQGVFLVDELGVRKILEQVHENEREK